MVGEDERQLDAALAGARLRFRPIVMTSFAFIVSCIPLAIASGSGAVSRKVLGTTVIGGMLAASALAIFLIPAGYCTVEYLAEFARRYQEPSGLSRPDTPPA